MVFNSNLVVTVANLSANLWQYVACNPERLSNQEVIDLVCCFPLQQLQRLAICLWTFFCFPHPDSYFTYSSDTSDDDSSSAGSGYHLYDSHSD